MHKETARRYKRILNREQSLRAIKTYITAEPPTGLGNPAYAQPYLMKVLRRIDSTSGRSDGNESATDSATESTLESKQSEEHDNPSQDAE
jgi:hypothetical protein